MAFVKVRGKPRYLNTITGEEISRRQYIKLQKGMSPEKLAERERRRDIDKALARPARGRTKTNNADVIKTRRTEYERQLQEKNLKAVKRAAKSSAKKIRLKKIRKQLLKAGKRAARIPFQSYGDYLDLRKQANEIKLSSGRRLITSMGIGIVGRDERTGDEMAATIFPMHSPRVLYDEEHFYGEVNAFLDDHSYFIFSHFFLHLHFDTYYAEEKARNAKRR